MRPYFIVESKREKSRICEVYKVSEETYLRFVDYASGTVENQIAYMFASTPLWNLKDRYKGDVRKIDLIIKKVKPLF